MSDLSHVRKHLATIGLSEFEAQNNPLVKDTWNEVQVILAEMNAAIEKAIDEVSQPFLQRLRDAEDQYAVILRLVA